MRVIKECEKRKKWQEVGNLVWAVGTHDGYLAMQGYYTEWQAVLENGIVAAHNSGNLYNEVSFLGNLGNAYFFIDQMEKAIEYHERSLGIACEINNRRLYANSLSNIGVIYNKLNKKERAICYYEKALIIYGWLESRDVKSEGIILRNIGTAYLDLGYTEEAIDYYKRALVIAKEIKDKRNEGY